ncbi:MAG TPA: MBL fold metallo-hydrolase [Caldilineaceae bacterium]|nr:MBL fold metallo-hydrolase [Caldilineaceae bacterium]
MQTTTYTAGEATLTVLDSGLLLYDMAEGLGQPEAAWRGRYDAYFEQPLQVPMQHVLVRTPQLTLLVDAGSYDLPEDSPIRVPGYTPPPSIPDQLRALGVAPERVEHLVITHLHLDHYNGLTEEKEGRRVLAFPNAQTYIGRADWENPALQERVQQPGTAQAATLGEVARQGLLRLVDEARLLAPGVEILPLPGETLGHLGVRVLSGEEQVYIVGDLYHHWVEVEQPSWHVTWADAKYMAVSRSLLTRRALARRALIIASHIPGAGRLVETEDGLRWAAA